MANRRPLNEIACHSLVCRGSDDAVACVSRWGSCAKPTVVIRVESRIGISVAGLPARR